MWPQQEGSSVFLWEDPKILLKLQMRLKQDWNATGVMICCSLMKWTMLNLAHSFDWEKKFCSFHDTRWLSWGQSCPQIHRRKTTGCEKIVVPSLAERWVRRTITARISLKREIWPRETSFLVQLLKFMDQFRHFITWPQEILGGKTESISAMKAVLWKPGDVFLFHFADTSRLQFLMQIVARYFCLFLSWCRKNRFSCFQPQHFSQLHFDMQFLFHRLSCILETSRVNGIFSSQIFWKTAM